MKDSVITARQKRRELTIAGICLGIAVAVNLGSIIYFHTPWYELFTQVGYTLLIALALYAVIGLVRLVVSLVKRLF